MDEFDQLLKKIDKFDDERKKNNKIIAQLEDRYVNLEKEFNTLSKEIKELTSEFSRMSVLGTRFEHIDTEIANSKLVFNKKIEEIEKLRSDQLKEREQIRKDDFNSINKTLTSFKTDLSIINDIKKKQISLEEEEFRINRAVDELGQRIEQIVKSYDETVRSQRTVIEGRSQDTKKISDLQTEASVLRKRVDEQRGSIDLLSDSVRKIELKVGELQTSENEQRNAQQAFIEKQNLIEFERERLWKEWETRVNEISEQGMKLSARLQEIENAHRELKRSKESFDEITERFERRINEISEMQRLADERSRQDWISFKSEDQKRWTNYTLGQDEKINEVDRQLKKINDRLIMLDDLTQELNDKFNQNILGDRKKTQTLIDLLQEWDELNRREFGNP